MIVPPDVTYEKEVVTSLTVQVEASSLVTTEIATGAQLHLDYSVVKADFEVRLNNTIQDTSSHKVGQVIQATDKVSFGEPSDKTRKYGILWNEEQYDYSINMGSLNFQFSIPTDRKFAGLKLLEEF